MIPTEQYTKLTEHYDRLVNVTMQPDLSHAERVKAQKEIARIQPVIDVMQELQRLRADIGKTENEIRELQGDLKELYEDELASLKQEYTTYDQRLDDLLYPAEEDPKSIFIEIRAGTGGQEAALFAGDLLRMYTQYALKKGWRATLISESQTDLGGYREVVLQITGSGVYSALSHESGVHRVQRVPATETGGRIHTSTATVAVLPEVEEVDVQINPDDLRIDVYRSGGAGGQHVNTTDSAVRITHLPSGIVVSCQDERSQHKNKAKALKVLQARLYAHQKAQQDESLSAQRKSQVGSGDRSEKIRTYNYPQNRVTDHQVNLSLQKLDMVVEGDLDDIVQALIQKAKEDRRQKPSLLVELGIVTA